MGLVRKILMIILAASFLLEAIVPCSPDLAKFDTEIYSGSQGADSAIVLFVQPARIQLNQNPGSFNMCQGQTGMNWGLLQNRGYLRLNEINASAQCFSPTLLVQGCLLQI